MNILDREITIDYYKNACCKYVIRAHYLSAIAGDSKAKHMYMFDTLSTHVLNKNVLCNFQYIKHYTQACYMYIIRFVLKADFNY